MKKFELNIEAEDHVKKYYDKLYARAMEQYELAKKAKATGKDVSTDVEPTPALDLADRCENIVGPKGIAERYRTVYEENGKNRMKTIFQLFREIINQEWCEIPDMEKRVEQAIKTGLVLVTEGVVVAPLDGVPQIRISKNFDGTKFIDIYYAGPIRAAGGTATVFPLILGDYARKLLELDRYKPTEEEIERYVEETQIYDEIFTRQYKLSPDEVRKIIRGCPVCINGEPTEEREVNVHKNLERVETNRVRGGACLVISEGVALKALKILSLAKMLELDWSWLEEIIKVSKGSDKESGIEPSSKYLGRIAAGRPIFCYPSTIGGFRLRYGRGRNCGTMGKAIHPATMVLSDEFLAVGTQLKIERPGKSAGLCACDSIEGPIVKLSNGEVRKIYTGEEATKIKPRVEKILFLGDILVSYGDFKQSAHPLVPPGYCSEWWVKELEKYLETNKIENIDTNKIIQNPNELDCFDAIELSLQTGLPLHPKYIHYYNALETEELKDLIESFGKSKSLFDSNKIVGCEIENTEKTKNSLEKIGLPHKIKENKIVIEEDYAYPTLKTFGSFNPNKNVDGETILEILQNISGLIIRDKCGTFLGARMGRPEAAKPRKMVGNPHMLFPIGFSGGSTRSINKAMDKNFGKVDVEVATFLCPSTEKITIFPYCYEQNERAIPVKICNSCGHISNEEQCKRCGSTQMRKYNKRKINVDKLMRDAAARLKTRVPDLVKGVKGLINENKIPEPLEKGILRANQDLHIFRDGTIRYELLNAPLTHFKPSEIKVSVEKLKELGYEKDIHGKPLENENQMLELFAQDVVIHDDAGDFMVRVTKFIDELLTKFYGVNSYYNINSKEELIGELLLGLAPHTSAAIIGRIIGYSKARVGFGHPYFHQCKRRNIDGDQDSVMLLMDGLLNFSESYLPSTRGGRMDAPLAFTIALNPTEIDDEVHNMEVGDPYPLEFYEKAQKIVEPKLDCVKTVKHILETKQQYSGLKFTHDTNLFDEGPKMSRYVQLTTMEEKIKSQAKVQNKIRAVNKKDALERVMFSHFLPDIIGNTRSFSKQNVRCTSCNEKYRRIPLCGKCTKCGGNLILTIAQGSVRKYLKIAKEIINTYELSDYLKQRIDLIESEIESIFKNDKVQQKNLFEYV